VDVHALPGGVTSTLPAVNPLLTILTSSLSLLSGLVVAVDLVVADRDEVVERAVVEDGPRRLVVDDVPWVDRVVFVDPTAAVVDGPLPVLDVAG
jgi:hypothetical protein